MINHTKCICITHPWHVETVCLLGNRKPDVRVKISVETEELKKGKEEK